MKKLYYIGRKPSASPAAGSHDQHVREQKDIVSGALGSTLTPKEVRDARPLETTKADRSLNGTTTTNVEVAVSKDGK